MLRRVGHVREVANATLFYACPESSYCTGGHLMVDGGQTACTVMDAWARPFFEPNIYMMNISLQGEPLWGARPAPARGRFPA